MNVSSFLMNRWFWAAAAANRTNAGRAWPTIKIASCMWSPSRANAESIVLTAPALTKNMTNRTPLLWFLEQTDKTTTKKRSSTFRIRSGCSLPSRMGCGTHVCARNDDRDDDRLRFYSFMPASDLQATVREWVHTRKINVRSCVVTPWLAHVIPPLNRNDSECWQKQEHQ